MLSLHCTEAGETSTDHKLFNVSHLDDHKSHDQACNQSVVCAVSLLKKINFEVFSVVCAGDSVKYSVSYASLTSGPYWEKYDTNDHKYIPLPNDNRTVIANIADVNNSDIATSSLELKLSNTIDTGQYRVQAFGESCHFTLPFVLVVYTSATHFQLLSGTSNQTIIEGKTVDFNCMFDVTGDVHELDTYWTIHFQNGSHIVIDNFNLKGQITYQASLQYINVTAKCGYDKDISLRTVINMTFLIKSSSIHNGAKITCVARRHLQNTSSSAFLNVINKPTVVTLPSKYLTITDHKRAVIKCFISGLTMPNSTVLWLKNGKQLISNAEKYQLELDSYNYTLVIRHVSKLDAGNYTCAVYSDIQFLPECSPKQTLLNEKTVAVNIIVHADSIASPLFISTSIIIGIVTIVVTISIMVLLIVKLHTRCKLKNFSIARKNFLEMTPSIALLADSQESVYSVEFNSNQESLCSVEFNDSPEFVKCIECTENHNCTTSEFVLPSFAPNKEFSHKRGYKSFQSLTDFTLQEFDHNGGRITIEDYAIKVTIPNGAIAVGDNVKFKVSASLYEPYSIPEGYRPISAYVSITCDRYSFYKLISVEIEHHAFISTTEDISSLCVLKTCENDNCSEMHEVTKGYKYEIGSSFCTYYTCHFCSLCLAAKSAVTTDRIMAYHYLPKDYQSVDEFKAELCFCYDLEPCRNRTKERFAKRNMLEDQKYLILGASESSELFLTLDLNNNSNYWNVILLTARVAVKDINFRNLYTCKKELQDKENTDVYPPRCLIKLNCHKQSILDVYYTLWMKVKHFIYFKNTELCKFNIFIKKHGEITLAMASSKPTYEELLSHKPELRSIMKIVVPKVISYWKDVFRSLNFDEYVISGIEAQAKDIKNCCEKAFIKWLESSLGRTPKTWNTLVCCIKEVDDLTAAVEKIEEELNMLACT